MVLDFPLKVVDSDGEIEILKIKVLLHSLCEDTLRRDCFASVGTGLAERYFGNMLICQFRDYNKPLVFKSPFIL